MSPRGVMGLCGTLVFLAVAAGGGAATETASQATAGVTLRLEEVTANCSKYRTLSVRTPQGRSAINDVRVVCFEPDVRYHRAGAPAEEWLPVEVGTVLEQGDEIACDPDGIAVLAFADNSTVVVHNTTQLKIASFFTEGGVVRTEILLRMGEVTARVNKSEATKSDFQIKQTTATSSVRGTTFTVLYDPIGKLSVTSVKEGVVSVDPTKAGLHSVDVGAGKEVLVTSKAVSKIAPIGTAGVPAGAVSPSKARQLVLTQLARNDERCKIEVFLFGLQPAVRGWTVSAKVSGGKKGWAVWNVKGAVVSATNPIARSIASGCR